MNIGLSPLTNTIYAGKSKLLSNGRGFQWIGKKEDVTDEAIRAVFEYMYQMAEETGFYEITFPSFGTMTLERVDGNKPNGDARFAAMNEEKS